VKVDRRDGREARQVLLRMVVDPAVASAVAARWDKRGLFSSRAENLVGGWAVQHFRKFGKPVGRQVSVYYDRFAQSSSDEEVNSFVGDFLQSLSDEHRKNGHALPADVALDMATRVFNKASLERLRDEIDEAVRSGDIDRGVKARDAFRASDVGGDNGSDVFKAKEEVKNSMRNLGKSLIRWDDQPAMKAFFATALGRDEFVAVEAPEKRQKCLDGDSEVLLESGELVRVEDMVKAKSESPVCSMNTQSRMFEHPAPAQHWDNGLKKCIEVTMRTGRKITVTPNHQFYTPDGWQEIADVGVGGFVAMPRRLNVFGTKPINEDELKFVAYMLADGCSVAHHSGIAAMFCKPDPEIQADFRSACDRLDVTCRPCKSRSGQLTLSGQARPLLRKYGLAGKSSRTKTIPKEVFTAPREQVALFLRLFFSCDGYKTVNRGGQTRVGITLANERMLRQISHLLWRFGIAHSLRYAASSCGGKKFDAWRIDIGSFDNVGRFAQDINMMSHKRITTVANGPSKSFLDKLPPKEAGRLVAELDESSTPLESGRRWEVLHQIGKGNPIMRQSFSPAAGTKAHDYHFKSDLMWDEVVSIEKVGLRQTYDIAVPGHHNFVADDCIVHNSWVVQELAFQAVMSRRRVAFFEVGDQSRNQILRRFVARAAGRPCKADELVRYPVELTPAEGEGGMPTVRHDVRSYPKKMTADEAAAAMQAFDKKYRAEFRLSVHPNSTINVNGIDALIDRWDNDGWGLPDVVCIAEGSLVLTDKGLVPIENVTTSHRVWDGVSWVNHGGAVYKGVRRVETYAGLTATEDHLVQTSVGWRTLGACRRLHLYAAQTGLAGTPVPLGRSFVRDRSGAGVPTRVREDQLRLLRVHQVQGLRAREVGQPVQPFEGYRERLPTLLAAEAVSEVAVRQGAGARGPVQQPETRFLQTLRGEGDRVPVCQCCGGLRVLHDGAACAQVSQHAAGQDRQRRGLRARQRAAVHLQAEQLAHQEEPSAAQAAQVPHQAPRGHVQRPHFVPVPQTGLRPPDDRRAVARDREEVGRFERVWDIVNAGPLHRFTVQGLLVHNCVDYADILAPMQGTGDTRDQINATWKALRQLSQKYHCLVVTATQSDADSYDVATITRRNFSEDKRKHAHVTGMVAINQTETERSNGLIRLNWVLARDLEFNESTSVYCAGCLAAGNPIVLSCF